MEKEHQSSASSVSADRESEKQRWLLASAILNTLLAAAKLGWGIWSANAVILADAVHSVSDVLGALVVYFAVRIAPHRSERFPMGLHKVEDLAAVIGGVGVAYAGYEVARTAMRPMEEQVHEVSTVSTVLFVAVMLCIQGAFWFYEKRAAKRLKSPGLNTDVANWLGDLGAGSVVMIGLAAAELDIPYAVPVSVMVIAGLILHSAYEVIRDGLLSLLDASVSDDVRRRAFRLIRTHEGVTDVQRLRLRRAGSTLFMTAVFETDESDFERAHDLADRMERRLHEAMPELEHVILHYEPSHVAITRVGHFDGSPETWSSVERLVVSDSRGERKVPVTKREDVPAVVAVTATVIREGVSELYVGALPIDPTAEVLLEAARVKVHSGEVPTE